MRSPLTPDEHLTVTDPKFEAQRVRTCPGMAHFAGTGPAGKTCRECDHWGCGDERGYFAKGGLKPRACDKFRELMNNVMGPAVPFDAAACKYFAPSTSMVPPIHNPKV